MFAHPFDRFRRALAPGAWPRSRPSRREAGEDRGLPRDEGDDGRMVAAPRRGTRDEGEGR